MQLTGSGVVARPKHTKYWMENCVVWLGMTFLWTELKLCVLELWLAVLNMHLWTKKYWVCWATENWKPFLSYVPAISILVRSWIVFVFLEDDHAT